MALKARPAGALRRIASKCYDHPWKVLAAWLALLISVFGFAATLGTAPAATVSLPESESAAALRILRDVAPSYGAVRGEVVFITDSSLTTPESRRVVSQTIRELREVPGLMNVEDPFEANPPRLSPDGSTAIAQLEFAGEITPGKMLPAAEAVLDVAAKNDDGAVRIELGGEPFKSFKAPQSELLGIAVAVLVLLLSFGTLMAVGLPIATALFGVALGAGGVGVASHFMSSPDFTITLALMIGLGVGVDYALFILARYLEEMKRSADPRTSTVEAVGTAGRSVVFAAFIVMISLLGMLVIQVPFVSALAIGSALSVATTLLAALTITPALLGIARGRAALPSRRAVLCVVALDVAVLGFVTHTTALTWFALSVAAGLVILTRRSSRFGETVALGDNSPRSGKRFQKWAVLVQRHPVRSFTAGVTLLLLLTAPVLSMRLGSTDNGNLPESETARRAYDAISAGFGPGANGPLLLLGEAPSTAALDAASQLTALVQATRGVVYVSPPTYIPGTRFVIWQVVPATGPQDSETSALISHLRTEVLPSAGLPVLVTGETASYNDFGTYLGSRLMAFMLTVLCMSFLLLLAVFRSVLVPLKAVLLNLLSISASYGVVTAVFQWGWGANLLGIGAPGPIEPLAPMMLFAIVFGLSMDYEVFLLSRIRESFNTTGDNTAAVTEGLVHTARVITAAAGIMVAVFGSFVLEDLRQVKLFGVGLAIAVLLDATVVRMLLVPATMEMLGARNWWLPRWLERVLPNVKLEHGQDMPAAVEPAEPAIAETK